MPQAQFIQHGECVDFTPAVDIAAGDVVVVGDLVGITKRDIKAETLGAIAVEGVFDVDKDANDKFALGEKVYWDSVSNLASIEEAGNKLLGKCVLASGPGNNKVRVRLSQ